ncbi:alcohol dehydrogenase catalytic domain-containing protein [Conexibacter woesei]|uniref:Alcohol dehydrogenase GroES domain protein n=1 Tax=Conexibacter woesei (strain DSM 14684 / CCUG 47730 / CIP 108061 / JCM 11494 / NBRC 100937 / ID131577) TaxID=469383 RepID=D3FD99_CONWI|nr:alcohol dehydrogenase catalytic domain-containing protein [Conexibacter woesei]ADB53491.1 Alcohol dehydrogenase GroES domain protein [Conexibacter woesei DSM 14684]
MIGLAKTAGGPGNVELIERPEREPAAGEVLLDVLAAGVCGTDLHIEAGEYAAVPPVTLGHELCGVVRAAGDGVDAALIGARVVSETFFSTCGACPPCREGRPNLCALRRSIGTHVDGAFAPRTIVPARNVHRIPAWLAPEGAALAEPLACVCQCMLDPAAVAPGERVLVVGPGPMGVLAGQVARTLGGEVVLSGLPRDAARLEVARGLGLEATDTLADGFEADVAIDASGSAAGAAICMEQVRSGGRFVQVGIFGRPVTVPLDLVLKKEIDLSTGFASTPLSWRRAIRMIERRDVALDPLVSEVAALGDWRRVFDDLRASRGMKVVFDPQASA